MNRIFYSPKNIFNLLAVTLLKSVDLNSTESRVFPIRMKSFWFLLFILSSLVVISQPRSIDKQLYHLRSTDAPEWKNFKGPSKKTLTISFSARENLIEQTLALRQEDVRQSWNVVLNGTQLGTLAQDENAMISYFMILPGGLKNEINELRIVQTDSTPDDIRIGEFVLIDQPLNKFLHQSTMEISVTDRTTNKLIPAHLTLVNSSRVLQPIAAEPDSMLAVRTGCIYTGTGKAKWSLPAGTYILYANRGFQYGVDSTLLVVKPGENVNRSLQIEKELSLDGWVSCDTHVHSLTYSGHGDASIMERIVTLAGEGIELPVITEHNRRVDIDSLSRNLNLRQYLTPIAGDEFTTSFGHFNIFPLSADAPVPDPKVNDWSEVTDHLKVVSGEPIIILNHARDIHNNFRPFDPKRHIGIAGMELDGWKFPANSMEVMNSGSQQYNIMQLYRDWFGMMNRGIFLTPVGSSDSHDVSRYLVGQSRTYIRYDRTDPSNIDRNEVINHFRKGEVMVSFGLLAEMKIDDIYGPGTIVPARKQVRASVKVLGPGWTEADSIFLFANGKLIRSEKIKSHGAKGIKWQGGWTIPISNQDIFLVAIATGPDPLRPFWPIPKPYQQTSTEWNPKIIGSSGAIWIDADGDGKRTSAYDHASKLIVQHEGNMAALFNELGNYDEAVSIQAAAILKQRHLLPAQPDLNNAPTVVKKGFESLILDTRF